MKFHPTVESSCNGRQEESKDRIKPKKPKIKEMIERLRINMIERLKKANQSKDKFKKPSSCHPSFPKAVGFANNKFSAQIYKEMLREKDPRSKIQRSKDPRSRSSEKSPQNVVMSAFSVFTVLSMLRLGAQGDTKKQITEALSLPGPRVAKC